MSERQEYRGSRVVVCTFATPDFQGSAELLRHTALRAGGADAVVVYGPDDVRDWFEQYPDLHGKRGYGWWSWKPYIIYQTLLNTMPGDLVVYMDAACMVERSLAPYAAAVRHGLLFRLGQWSDKDYRNRVWTKRDTFALMGMNEDRHRDAIQLNAGVQMYRNTPVALDFVKLWMKWCSVRNVIDDACVLENDPAFRDHRHDQSVLSVLVVDSAIDVARDPTQYGTQDPALLSLAAPAQLESEHDTPLVTQHRAKRRPARIAVITPSTGGRHLDECLRSVQDQDLPNVHHYVVADGPDAEAAVRLACAKYKYRKPIHVLTLPHNVGAGGWNGHRVYGSLPWLVDADYVAYLDDDNAFDADHLRVMVRSAVNAKAPWAYSLRRIVDQDGVDVCPDNCESLGGICPTVCGPHDRLIDTNCYLIQRDLAIETSAVWNARFRDPTGRPEPDRQLCKVLLSTAPHACVRRHSVRYRVANTERSVRAQFFVRGNETYGYDFACKPDLYVFHFSPAATARFLACRRATDRSYALDEWQMTLLRGLDSEYNLLDGYACAPNLPPGSLVYVSMCAHDQVPWSLLEQRTDCWRVGYTLESPNIRHADQWDPALLSKHFDVVLTYWTETLKALGSDRAMFTPHNTHHLDFDNPLDVAQLRTNTGQGKSCAMVLERRPGLTGTYRVPGMGGVELRCLDPLREALVRDLDDVTVHGVGWGDVARTRPNVKLGHQLHRSQDPRHAVDILSGYTFALVVENTDADGYVSEKLYDALIAGAIPLWYGGRVPDQLDIPEGVETGGVYVNLKKSLGDPPPELLSAELQHWLSQLDQATVDAMKARVAQKRERVLRQVDVRAFADAVKTALNSRRA